MAPDTPPMSELLSRFLTGQADARAAGFSEGPAAEVEPFEAVAFATVEPRAAWAEAVQALAMLDTEASGITVAPPADWAGLVSGAASAIAVPMAAGNFPQLVRDLTALIDSGRAATLPSRSPVSLAIGGLDEWAARAVRERRFPDVLLAAGTLRLAGHWDRAAELLAQIAPLVPARWHVAFENERAALAWESGDVQTARKAWSNMADSAPVCFNRGLAALFANDKDVARAEFTRAAAMMAEDDPWQHLARLYLALAQM